MLSPDAQRRAALAALALLLLVALFALGDRLMKKLPILVACVAALALAGCNSLGFTAATQDAIGKAVAEKIPYCSGDIQITAGVGGIAGSGTGIANAGQLHCPGKPYDAGAAPAAAAKPADPA